MPVHAGSTNQTMPGSQQGAQSQSSQAGKVPMDIQTFRTAFDGGTRPNRFKVSGHMGTVQMIEPLMVKAASMPIQNLGVMQVPFRGRVAKIPGDRVYPEWTFTMLDMATKNIRRDFEEWHAKFNMHKENIPDPNAGGIGLLTGSSSEYSTWTVTQVDMMGNEIRTIGLNKCWPVEVGPIDLSYDTSDVLTEYSVTLAFDYLELLVSSGLRGGNKADADAAAESAAAASSAADAVMNIFGL
mgnify:CR=1 FL=1